jgi:hypothetical protein
MLIGDKLPKVEQVVGSGPVSGFIAQIASAVDVKMPRPEGTSGSFNLAAAGAEIDTAPKLQIQQPQPQPGMNLA